MNTQASPESDQNSNQDSDQYKNLKARLARLDSARKQALINLEQLDKTIDDLYMWLYSDLDHNRNSDSYDLFNRLSKLDKLNSKDNHLADFYFHLKNIRSRIANCCQELVFKVNHSTGSYRLDHANFCMNYTLCPSCAIRRSGLLYKLYADRYKIIKLKHSGAYTSLVTLTIKNGYDLKERFNHIKKSVTKLHDHGRRARNEERGYKSEFKHAIASFCTIEVTKNTSGWHVHGHLIVIHNKSFDFSALQSEWNKITGDSNVLNVRSIDDLDDAVEEFKTIFGYVTKSSESESLAPFDAIELYAVTRGQHFCDPFGEFRGIKLPKTLIDKDHDDPSFVSVVLQYSPEFGYRQLA